MGEVNVEGRKWAMELQGSPLVSSRKVTDPELSQDQQELWQQESHRHAPIHACW